MSGNCEWGRGLRRREKNATEAGAGRYEKPAPDTRAAPPEARESLIGRKTVEEVPLTGLSFDLRAWVGPSGLIVEVADTGKGIPAEDVPHLFDRYYRPERAAEGGLGLGLTIVKRVAELHGGAASVESFPGRGTTARLAFPLSDR
jgi:signal transduction histidine kinase